MTRLIPAMLIVTWATISQANPPDLFGFGARAVGLGGAMTAAVDDTSATFYNPAALTRHSTLQIDTGYLLSTSTLELNGGDTGVDDASGTQIGVAIPGQFGNVNVAFGLGLHLPKDRLSRVRALPQHQPRWVMYDNRPQRILLNVNLAVRPWPWLHIGAGINFLTHTQGSLNLQGLLFATEVERSALATAIDVTFTTVRYPSIGLLISPNEDWSFGVCYREEVSVKLDLGARVEGAVVLGGIHLPGHFELRSYNHNQFTPRQLWFGGTWRPTSSTLITADVGWLNWSSFLSPTASVSLELEIENFPTEGLLPPPTDVIAPQFHDTFGLRTGIEWTMEIGNSVNLDVRGGYGFEPTPAPEQTGNTNYIDTDKHTLSLGLGVTISRWNPWVNEPLSLDIGLQWIELVQRRYLKDDPADLVGDYHAGGQLFTLASTARWRF